MSQQEVIDAEYTEVGVDSASIVPAPQMAISKERLRDIGIMLPIAEPAELRAAFAEKQRLYAAILDPSDYLYTVSYKEGTATRQYVSTNKKYAEKYAEQYSSVVIATPKKSGIVKLARALGIVAKRTDVKGLPNDATATYSYVVYEAIHEASGTVEQGVGWCDVMERGGKISRHDVIATADTRAYNRAILRLSGFGDVSADEVIAGPIDESTPTFVPEPPRKRLPPLPSETDVDVVAAQSEWARAVAKGTGFAPDARQDTFEARVLRARARRGDTRAAHDLGVSGLAWAGRAQDNANTEAFEVGPSQISPESVAAVDQAASESLQKGLQEEAKKPAPAASPTPAAQPAAASTYNQVEPPPEAKPELILADPNGETITTAQAKRLSAALVEFVGGDRDKARKWLLDRTGAMKSTDIRGNQYEKIMKILEKKEAQGG